ncbi:MAG: PEP/pyruvate-binding domain-containing protein [Solirubrobacterales bacterium]
MSVLERGADVIGFDRAPCLEVARAGGKGASLARMTALELPVPPGFVVAASCLAEALPDGGAALRAELVAAGGSEDFAAAAERAQRLVRELRFAERLREEIAAAYAALGREEAVAVRSSACAEDSETASFAGQQETYLHVRGVEPVLDRIRECWASFFSERALFYRARMGSLEDLRMAVVVQRMVDADVAGVLFTVDPTKGRRDRMVVESVFGLGEALVSGELTPDRFVLSKDGRLKRTRLAAQPYAIVRHPEGGVQRRQLPPELGAAQSLDEEQLRELARIARGLEDRLEQPQDIEWAIEADDLFVLQARPVTA